MFKGPFPPPRRALNQVLCLPEHSPPWPARHGVGLPEGQLTLVKQEAVPALGDNAAHFVLCDDDPYRLLQGACSVLVPVPLQNQDEHQKNATSSCVASASDSRKSAFSQ